MLSCIVVMFLVLTSCNIGRWDGVILIVMNIEMGEEIKRFMECSQIYCCNFLSVQCELSVSFFLCLFWLSFCVVFGVQCYCV